MLIFLWIRLHLVLFYFNCKWQNMFIYSIKILLLLNTANLLIRHMAISVLKQTNSTFIHISAFNLYLWSKKNGPSESKLVQKTVSLCQLWSTRRSLSTAILGPIFRNRYQHSDQYFPGFMYISNPNGSEWEDWVVLMGRGFDGQWAARWNDYFPRRLLISI